MTYALPQTPRTAPQWGPMAHVYTHFLLTDENEEVRYVTHDSADASDRLDALRITGTAGPGWTKHGVTVDGQRISLKYLGPVMQ